jgi:hypothetical protein
VGSPAVYADIGKRYQKGPRLSGPARDHPTALRGDSVVVSLPLIGAASARPLPARLWRHIREPAGVGLAYQSQRQSPEDRAVERSLKARKKLGVFDNNMLDTPYCPKPKWMRRKTHRRLVGVISECHKVQVRYMIRRWGRVL